MSKSLAHLNTCSRDDFIAALGNIFEHSPWIAEQAAMKAVRRHQPAVRRDEGGSRSCAPELRLVLIKAHPDLADKT